MTRSPYELIVRAECLQLLAASDQRDPWNYLAVQKLTNQLYALINDLTKPRILDVHGGEAAAKLLCGALGANQ